MEANQRRQEFSQVPDQPATFDSEAGEKAVMERHDLKASAKLGFRFLRQYGDHRSEFTVHAVDVGASVGARDALKTGKSILQDLDTNGIIAATKVYKGNWHVKWLKVPSAIQEGLRVIPRDPQGHLFQSTSRGETPCVVAFDPPTVNEPDAPLDRHPDDRPVDDLRIGIESGAQIEGLSIRDEDPRDTSGRTSGRASGITISGAREDMDRLAAAKTASDRSRQAHEDDFASMDMRNTFAFAIGRTIGKNEQAKAPETANRTFQWIMSEINDSDFMPIKAMQVAEDIAAGLIDRFEVATLLHRINRRRKEWFEAGQPQNWHKGRPFSAGALFNANMFWIYKKKGLTYKLDRRPRNSGKETTTKSDPQNIPY